MLFEKKLFWHWNRISELEEKNLIDDDGNFQTLSVISACLHEIMIFLDKVAGVNEYKVRVYKDKPGFVFAPNAYDEFVRYEENEEFDTFFFKTFEKAREFIDIIPSDYPEYRMRPQRFIEQNAS
jgi:hypothetical protein